MQNLLNAGKFFLQNLISNANRHLGSTRLHWMADKHACQQVHFFSTRRKANSHIKLTIKQIFSPKIIVTKSRFDADDMVMFIPITGRTQSATFNISGADKFYQSLYYLFRSQVTRFYKEISIHIIAHFF